MESDTKGFVLDVLGNHNVLRLATIRPDGWPQVTAVGYVNDGLTIYVGIYADSQKAQNVRHCDKVSLTIDRDIEDWARVRGLSMAALAEIVSDADEIARVDQMMMAKFPQMKDVLTPGNTVILRITPKVASLLDYTKGFGHTELIEV